MKKVLIIASAVILLLCLTVALIVANIPRCPAPISEKSRGQLIEDYYKIYTGGHFSHCWYSEGSAGYSYENCRIYGKDNGYILFFVSTHHMPMEYENTVIIEGLEFYNPEPFSFYAYKDGKFIDISNAYEQGLISMETLVKAHEYHYQCFGTIHTPVEMTEWDQMQYLKAAGEDTFDVLDWAHLKDEKSYNKKRYYGNYNGYFVICDQVATQGERIETIGEYDFYLNGRNLVAWKDGKCYELSLLYEQGEISDANLNAIYWSHMRIEWALGYEVGLRD